VAASDRRENFLGLDPVVSVVSCGQPGRAARIVGGNAGPAFAGYVDRRGLRRVYALSLLTSGGGFRLITARLPRPPVPMPPMSMSMVARGGLRRRARDGRTRSRSGLVAELVHHRAEGSCWQAQSPTSRSVAVGVLDIGKVLGNWPETEATAIRYRITSCARPRENGPVAFWQARLAQAVDVLYEKRPGDCWPLGLQRRVTG